jgi:hypothetical protein
LNSTRGSPSAVGDDTRKPGSAAITAPKPYSDAVLVAASSAPATAALLPSAKRSLSARKANDHHRQDAEEQRAFHRPDRRHRGHLGDHRLRQAGQRCEALAP